MIESLVITAEQIMGFAIKGSHPARIICYDQLSFRAMGDRAGESTRLIGVSPLRYDPDGFHLEEIGYMAGGQWLKPVILPVGAEEVKIEPRLVVDPTTRMVEKEIAIKGLPRGTWSRIYDEVEQGPGEAVLEILKGQHENWRLTGLQPSYGLENYVPDRVAAGVEAAWKPLDAGELEILQNGLTALLLCLKEQPQPREYILSLPLHTKGTAG